MDSSKLNQLLELQERLAHSPVLKAADQLARQLHDSQGMKAAVLAADQLANSPALKAADQLARQLHDSQGMKAAVLAVDRLVNSPALKAADQLARQLRDSQGMKAAALAADRLVNSPALKAAVLAAGQLARMPPLPLTPELFGAAWDERLEAAVGRLERAEDIIADAPDPKRAVEELAEDAATVQEAAPAEAQERVNTRLSWLRVRRELERLKEVYTWITILSFILKFLGVPVPELPTAGELLPAVQKLQGVTRPDRSPVSALDLPTTQEIKPATTALTLPSDLAVEGLPAIVERAGPAAAERVVEFFTAQIRNANTRAAYAKAVTQFFTWCDERGLELDQISAVAVAAYVEELQGVYRAPTIKQHLAAIRRLFDWLVVGQVVPWNPTAAVRGPTHVVKRGKTPVLQPGEVRLLLGSIDTAVGGLRDRALMGVMIYSFARVSAVVNMDVDDYYQQGKRWWLRLREKGGKHHALPVHHKAEAYLDAYLAGAGIAAERGSPLWRSLTRTRELGERRMSRVDVFRMVKRRVKAAELGDAANCHTFRASGITAYLLNGGTLERAQAIAGHESPRTTQLYDRTADDITVEDIERIKV